MLLVMVVSSGQIKPNSKQTQGATSPHQKTAARPFFEWRLLNRFRPFKLTLSASLSIRSLWAGMLTPSRAPSPPMVLAGDDMVEESSLNVESPEYEFVIDWEIAKSRAYPHVSHTFRHPL